MNKLYFYVAWALLGLTACTTEPFGVTESESEERRIEIPHLVTLEQAQTEVEDLLAALDPPTRGTAREINEVFTVGGFGATRSADGEEEPLYYVFNLGDNEGFAVASGDDRTPAIFCITEKGEYNPGDTLTVNAGMAMLLWEYDASYRAAVGLPIVTPDGVTINPGGTTGGSGSGAIDDWTIVDGNPRVTVTTTPYEVKTRGTLLPCSWGQGEPFNMYMEKKDGKRCLTGCGAVAVAQVMCHYRYPSSIGEYDLDWEKMSTARFSTDPGIEDVARLMQQLAGSTYLKSDTGVDITTTRDARIQKTFELLGYHCSDEIEDGYKPADLISTIMTKEWPVIMSGYAIKTVNALGFTVYSEGHYWVCDQIKACTRTINTYVNGKLASSRAEGDYYVHCNWGWGGYHNGYFLPWQFDTRNPIYPNKLDELFEDKTRSQVSGEEDYYQFNLSMWHEIYY